jgi:MFS family permease
MLDQRAQQRRGESLYLADSHPATAETKYRESDICAILTDFQTRLGRFPAGKPMNEIANHDAKTLQRDLRAILADGAAYSVMVGIGESYVPAFALALGLGEVAAGLIATVPMLAGGVLQLASPWAVRSLGSHRRWVVTCASCQALSLLLLLGMALARGLPAWLVFVPATLYWGAGLATGPAWNAWVERLVPGSMRATFFAQRTKVSHVCVLVGLIAGGIILRTRASDVSGAAVFAVLFAIAAASRTFSATMLARQSEPSEETYLDQTGASYRDVLRDVRGVTGTKLIVYLLAVQVAVHLAGPFFTPYMLGQLRLSYLQYMVLLSCGFLGKILAMPWAGRFAQRAGAGRLLWFGGVAIIPLSALWLVSDSIPYLIIVQVVGGMAWAAFELAMLLLFFETIPRGQRVSMLSLYNFGNAVATVAGALLGAAIIHSLADGRTAYLAVFGISSVARIAALLLIPQHPPEPTELAPPTGLRTLAVRPMDGSLERPILPAIGATDDLIAPNLR